MPKALLQNAGKKATMRGVINKAKKLVATIDVRGKGDEYERKIARLFTNWLDTPIQRRGRMQGRVETNLPDLEFLDINYKRFDRPNGGIECRKREVADLTKWFNKNNPILEWIEEYRGKYGSYDKFIIVFSKNHLHCDLALVDSSVLTQYDESIMSKFPRRIVLTYTSNLYKTKRYFTVVPLRDLLANIDKEFFAVKRKGK